MNSTTEWILDQATPYLLVAIASMIAAWVWHHWDDGHREPTGTVSDWMDAAKARQFGQPHVSVDVFDHYDPRNDVEVAR